MFTQNHFHVVFVTSLITAISFLQNNISYAQSYDDQGYVNAINSMSNQQLINELHFQQYEARSSAAICNQTRQQMDNDYNQPSHGLDISVPLASTVGENSLYCAEMDDAQNKINLLEMVLQQRRLL